jgi:WD40 repeat protein
LHELHDPAAVKRADLRGSVAGTSVALRRGMKIIAALPLLIVACVPMRRGTTVRPVAKSENPRAHARPVWSDPPLPDGAVLRIGHVLAMDSAMAFSPDGRLLATESRDRSGYLQVLATGERLFQLPGDGPPAFSRDGKLVARASLRDHEVVVWSIDAKTPVAHLTMPRPKPLEKVLALLFRDKDNTLTLVNTWHSFDLKERVTIVHQWDFESGQDLGTLDYPEGPSAAVVLPDGTIGVVMSEDGATYHAAVHRFGAVTNTHERIDGVYGISRRGWVVVLEREGHWSIRDDLRHERFARDAQRVQFSEDGRFVLVFEAGGILTVVRADDGAPVFSRHIESTYALIAPDGRTLVVSMEDGPLRFFDVPSGDEVLGWEGHRTAVRSVAWSPDGKTIATLDSTALRLWDSSTGRLVRVLREIDAYPSDRIAFSPDGKRILIELDGYAIGKLRVEEWDVASGATLYTVSAGKDGDRNWYVVEKGAVYLPDGSLILAVSSSVPAAVDAELRLRVVDPSRTTTKEISVGLQTAPIEGFRVFPNGARVLVATSDGARVIEPATGKELAISVFQHQWFLAAWAASDSLIFSYIGAHRLDDVDAKRGVVTHTARIAPLVGAVSPRGDLFAGADDDNLVISRASDLGEVARFPTGQHIIHDVAFSPDGRFVATAGHDGSVLVFRAGGSSK